MIGPVQRVFAFDPDLNPCEIFMEFRLTYAGRLHSNNERRERQRSLKVHELRKVFHRQLKVLWDSYPVLAEVKRSGSTLSGSTVYVVSASETISLKQTFEREGFNWLPLVTRENGLICSVDILMLRTGPPGEALADIDNRLKPVFDALRMAQTPNELGAQTSEGRVKPEEGEDPFYVVLEDDKLITHLSATTDTLLEPVPDVPRNEAVRLVINVTIRPYRGFLETVGYT
jgi:hypothetical protein